MLGLRDMNIRGRNSGPDKREGALSTQERGGAEPEQQEGSVLGQASWTQSLRRGFGST